MSSLNLIKPIHLRLAAMTVMIAAIVRGVTTLVPSNLAAHRFSFGLCFVPLVLAGTAGALLYEEGTRLKFTLESIRGGALPRELETQWRSGAARKRAHPWPHAVVFGGIATAALGLSAKQKSLVMAICAAVGIISAQFSSSNLPSKADAEKVTLPIKEQP